MKYTGKNDTSAFLYCFYSEFGGNFIDAFNKLFIVNHYLADYKYRRHASLEEFLDDSLIFTLVNKNLTYGIEKHLEVIKNHENFITDYEVDDEFHVVVFHIDGEYKECLRQFKLGNYSKMYSSDVIARFFTKSKSYFAKYVSNDREVNITSKNCDSISSPLDFNYDLLQLSNFHILTKSDGLRQILECILKCDIPEEAELKGQLKLANEILNYEEKVDIVVNDIVLEKNN